MNSLTANRFKRAEIQNLWKRLSEGNSSMNKYQFRASFDNIGYTGNSTVRTMRSGTKAKPESRTTIYS